MTTRALTPAAAYRIASDWGSYLNSSDPGACFYGFHKDDGRPVSEEHRAQCLAYLDRHCLPAAGNRDAARLRKLRSFLISTPLWPEAGR